MKLTVVAALFTKDMPLLNAQRKPVLYHERLAHNQLCCRKRLQPIMGITKIWNICLFLQRNVR